MQKLIDVPNTDGASSDYPKGNVRDKVGITAGTTGGAVLFADIIQFFQKLVIDAGITENSLPDNVSNGYQLIEALVDKINQTHFYTKIINIGIWDMDSTGSITIATGISDFKKIRKISVIIKNDADTLHRPFYADDDGNDIGLLNFVGVDSILLIRKSGGKFDTPDYNDGAINRGYIVIDYIA